MSILRLWYALQIRCRYERVVAGSLTVKGYDVFLPTYTDPKGVERVLFGGYLFCRIGESVTGKIVTTTHVLRIVGGHKPVPVDDLEIQNLMQTVKPQVRCQPYRYLPIGSRVRIENGPLAGVEGILASEGNSKRLIVSIHLLRRSVAAVLDEGMCVSPLFLPDQDSHLHQYGAFTNGVQNNWQRLPQLRESLGTRVERSNHALRSVA
jgi:transcription antitermination factor NusG